MRDIIYFIASSLDGFIARPDGSFEAFPFDATYGNELMARFPETFPAPYRQQVGNTTENQLFDTVLMGRATYDVGAQLGLTSPYPTLDQHVISTSLGESPDPAVTVISDNIVEHIRELQNSPGKAIWLCGGGKLASLLLAHGMISRVMIKLNPVMFGSGIPLFAAGTTITNLRLTDQHTFTSGHVLLSYEMV